MKNIQLFLLSLSLITLLLQSFSTITVFKPIVIKPSPQLIISGELTQENHLAGTIENPSWQICLDSFVCSQYCQCYFATIVKPEISLPHNFIVVQAVFDSSNNYQFLYSSSIFRPPIT
jgi:hypothetical protein